MTTETKTARKPAAKKAAPKPEELNSRQGVEEALAQILDTGAEEVTGAEVQELAASLTPAVKDGYASFWLTKFHQQGVHVERVKRGTYRLLDAVPELAAAKPADDWAARTKKELLAIADEQGVEVARSATKAKIAELLGGTTR